MDCDKCRGTGAIINADKTVSQCICVRRGYIIKELSKKTKGDILFKNPSDLVSFEPISFIATDLNTFKDYLAGYLLYKSKTTFKIMGISEYFSYRMDNSDNLELLKPDLLILNFASIFFNKAAPLFIMQICDERAEMDKKTWLVSGLSRGDLEVGFKESKDVFSSFLDRIALKTYNRKKKSFGNGRNIFATSVSEVTKGTWKDSI